VSLKQPEATASLTIPLQPNLHLIVEVHEAANPDRKISGASVSLRLKDSNAMIGRTHDTNDQGEAVIDFADSPSLPVDRIRSGLTVVVGKEKYETKESAVSAELLEPSAEPRRLTVF